MTYSGKGTTIPPEALPHVFERFYRTDTEHTTDGLGLGLSIALKIAELHQGDIHITSNPGDGSTFTMTLPIMDTTQIK